MNKNDFNLEKWAEIIKKHYTIMRGFHPETYEITLGDIEATARFFYDLGLKKAMEEKPTFHVERMLNEQKELCEKTKKLAKFISENPIFGTLSAEEQYDMHLQLQAMSMYSAVLQHRIDRAKGNDTKTAE